MGVIEFGILVLAVVLLTISVRKIFGKKNKSSACSGCSGGCSSDISKDCHSSEKIK